MGSPKSFDIGIAGAGSAGLFLALLLHEQGHRVHLFERSATLRCEGCGILVVPAGLEAIEAGDQRDLLDAMLAAGRPVSRFVMRNLRGDLINTSPASGEHGELPALLIHREAIMTALAERLAPGSFRGGAEVISWRQDADAVEAVLADGQRWSGDLLVGADGLFSKVAPLVAPERRLNYLGDRVWRGVVADDQYCTDGEFFVYARGRGVYANSFDLGVNADGVALTHWGLFQEDPLPAERSEQKRLLEEGVPEEALSKLPEDLVRVITATPRDQLVANWTFDIDPLPRIVRGRVALIGDAAHAMSSSQARGMTSGWEDGVELSRQLQAHRANGPAGVAAALAAYQETRLPLVHQRQAKSREVSAKVGRLRKPQVLARAA
jgi:2-polyprenyl-6-methoxyphenol hydroxylase-like FAD-dependent oxidoreductase